MKFELKGDQNTKIGYYRSLFTRDYQVLRAKYDSRIRNWHIEYSNPYFIVEDSSGTLEFVYHNGKITNCTCDHFLTNESGTCMHIEAVNILPRKDVSPLMRESIINCQFLDSYRGEVLEFRKNKKDILTLPSVRIFRDIKSKFSGNYGDISNIEDYDIFTEYGINLYDYQIDSVKRMLTNKRTVLTLKMGLGKTICSLVATKLSKKDKILIVCPNNLKYQWKSEIDRFQVGTSLVIDKGGDFQKYVDQNFLIMSYEMLNRNIDIVSSINFDILISDEIQKIKNPDSVSWKSMSMVKSEYIFALSGTPIQNSIHDILSIISFLNPYEFKPEWKFWEQYCDFTRAKLLGIKKSKISDFRSRISEYIINPVISKNSIKLPKVNENEISCTLDRDSKKLHDSYLDMATPLIAKSFNYPLTFGERARLNSLLTLARMSSTDSRLIDPMGQKSNRFTTIEDLIDEIVSKGEKVVIYSEWIKSTKLLIDYLDKSKIGYSIFNGEMSAKKREIEKMRFLKDPKTMVFLSTDSGGLGIDGLQLVSNNIIHIEKMWNPAKVKQRNGRLVRNLQKSDEVNVYYLTCNSEIEKMIDSATFRKDDLVDSVLK